MILVIDNKDSFVYNLVAYVNHFADARVVENDITPEDVAGIDPDGILISPGPGSPDGMQYVGRCVDIIKSARCPILGVCLGHQAIAYAFGGRVGRIEPVHGKASLIIHDRSSIYKGLPERFSAGRYHSLAVVQMPDDFYVSARSEDGTIMGIRSLDGMIEGVQFHPESILTGFDSGIGLEMIRNFVSLCGDGDG